MSRRFWWIQSMLTITHVALLLVLGQSTWLLLIPFAFATAICLVIEKKYQTNKRELLACWDEMHNCHKQDISLPNSERLLSSDEIRKEIVKDSSIGRYHVRIYSEVKHSL
jgi:hypothetical protein